MLFLRNVRGGGIGSDPVLVGPPRKQSLALVMCLVDILVNSAFVFGMVFASLYWSDCKASILCGHVGSEGPAKSRTHPLGDSVMIGSMCGYCATGGGSRGGGVFGPLGTTVPWGDSPREGRAAHGPLHPAVNRSLETLMALLFVFLLWSWFCYLVACIVFFCLWGWYFVWSFSPSKLDPFLASCLLSSISLSVFFLFSLFVATFCSRLSSLSLSGAGETQTFLVWVSLCVFFFMAAIAHSDPYSEFRTYT